MISETPRLDFPRHQCTVDEVSRMVDQGILGEDERVELPDGNLVLVSPPDPRHAARLGALALTLSDAYRANAHVRRLLGPSDDIELSGLRARLAASAIVG